MAGPAAAQSSRSEEHAQRQAAKAKRLKPYHPSRAERLISRLSHLQAPVGPYPFVGGVMSGGGLATGPAVRRPFGDIGVFNAHAAWSIHNYKTVAADVTLPTPRTWPVRLTPYGSWIDAPGLAFYGIGNDSSKSARTNFLFRPATVGVTGALVGGRWFSMGGGVEYLRIETDTGRGGAPSIDTRFTPATAPGLGLDTDFLVARAFVQIDTRRSPGYSRHGSFGRVQLANYVQREGQGFDFRRLDAEVQQIIPILRANWVIALRGLATLTDADSGNDVPYFLMPALGGGRVLRGYPNYRFRDRNRLLGTIEYRWTPSYFLDMVLFYEAGKVASTRDGLDVSGMHGSYGIGARFHAPTTTVLRFELARSREGTRFIIGLGPVF
jgi:hypothetical protein